MPTPDEWHEQGQRILSQETCRHPDSEPYDEGACFGFCPTCGKVDIPNNFAGHYPCWHAKPMES